MSLLPAICTRYFFSVGYDQPFADSHRSPIWIKAIKCTVRLLQNAPAPGHFRPQKSVGSVPCSKIWVTDLMVFNQPRKDSRHRQIRALKQNLPKLCGGCDSSQSGLVVMPTPLMVPRRTQAVRQKASGCQRRPDRASCNMMPWQACCSRL